MKWLAKMKAYMIEGNKKLEPFGDHPGDCLIANRKLREIQKEVLQSLGIGFETTPDLVRVKDPNEHIIFDDSLLFTRELLQKFISKSLEFNHAFS